VAITAKSLDEVTADLVDAYDELVAPKRVWRNNNNKLYLFFRACANGIKLLLDVVLALRNRFDPERCSDEDLLFVAKWTGAELLKGSGSALRVVVANVHPKESKTLLAGEYRYDSVSGMAFSFTLPTDAEFGPGSLNVVTAISQEKGSYPVSDNASITFYRPDGGAIDGAFRFSCENNANSLGYPDEDAFSFRKRVLSDTNRQDSIKELELKIKSLPNIFECGLMLNQSLDPVEYDGVTLKPLELLVTITGVPSDELARLVVQEAVYSTHMVDPANVAYYRNDQYIGGKYPVYFRYHERVDFSLEIEYQYSSQKIKKAGVEAELGRALSAYKNASAHVDLISEADINERLSALLIPSFVLLRASITRNGERVAYFRVPLTRIHNLVETTYVSLDTMGEEA
jgi:hypothetical protein